MGSGDSQSGFFEFASFDAPMGILDTGLIFILSNFELFAVSLSLFGIICKKIGKIQSSNIEFEFLGLLRGKVGTVLPNII